MAVSAPSFQRLGAAIHSSLHPPYQRSLYALADVLGRTGTDYSWARTFPEPLLKCGLLEVDAVASVPILRGGSALAEFLSLTIGAVGGRIIEAGLLTETELDRAHSMFADPAFWDFGPALVGCWGRKPAL